MAELVPIEWCGEIEIVDPDVVGIATDEDIAELEAMMAA